MRTFAEFVLRYRKSVIAVVILVTLLLGYAAMKTKLNADFSTYLSQDDPLVEEFDRIGEVFKANYIGMVLIESEDVFTAENLRLLRELTEAYKGVAGVSSVTSLYNAMDFEKTEDGLIVGRLIEGKEIPKDSKELARLREYVLSKEMYLGSLVNEEGAATVILLRLLPGVNHFKVAGEIDKITQEIAPSTEKIYYGGMPFLIYSMTGLILDNMFILVPLIILLLLGVLELGFRKLGGVLMPLVVVLLAVVWAVGLMALFGVPIDLLSGIMPVILIAMGSADGIHFMRRYYEERSGGGSTREAVRVSVAEMGVPIIFTSITTIIGFASLVISDFDLIKQFGLVTALGIFLALVVTLTFIPALLSLSKGKAAANPKPRRTRGENRAMARLGDLIYKNRRAILGLTLAVVVVAAAGIPWIVMNVDWSLCLKRGSKPYQAEMLLRREFGGSVPILVSIQGDIKDPATLKIMRSVERYLDTVPAVSESESIASVLAEMNYVMNDRYAIPETRRGVTNLWFLLKGQDILDQLVTPQGGEALVQAKVNSLATAVVSRAVESGDEFIKTLPTRLVVVNSGDLSGEVQRELLAIQRERIVDDVLWELQAEGIAIERGPVAELVGGGRDFTLGSLPEEMYGIIQNSIKGYLQSDMAEIPFGEAQAEALAGEITTAMMEAEQRLSPAEIEEIVRPRVVVEYPEEITWLSESLAILIAKTAGELRVDGVFQKLEGFLPAGALDANLAKEIKGSLWGLNEQTVLLDEEEYQRLSANLDLGQVRRVSLAIKQSGMAPILNRMEKELLPTQIESTILALLAVTILLILVFRSLKSGLIGIVPVALTILVNFAVLGYFGIGLDSFTAMIASITIGLGIDYAIHFTSRFKLELGRAEDERAALKRTLQTTGVAILINAFSIGAGFSALLLAGGQHIRLLGGLTALALVVAALFTLFVIPALSLTFKPGYMRHSIAERGAGERAREARVSEADRNEV